MELRRIISSCRAMPDLARDVPLELWHKVEMVKRVMFSIVVYQDCERLGEQVAEIEGEFNQSKGMRERIKDHLYELFLTSREKVEVRLCCHL